VTTLATARQNLIEAIGSTAVLVVIIGKEIYTAWAGDAEAAMVRQNGEVANFVVCHKTTSEVRTVMTRKRRGQQTRR